MNIAVRAASVALVLLTAACAGGGNPPVEPLFPAALEGKLSFERKTSFDGEALRLDFPREDGGTESFSTARDMEYSTIWSRTFIPNHAGRAWWLMKTSTEGTSFVYAVVSWDNDDPSDYLALGYWLHFPGERPDGYFWRFTPENAKNYPFFDGPEFDPSDPPLLPVSGQATYFGQAQGLYSYQPGGGGTGLDEPVGVAEFTGTLMLTADFEDNTLSGCLGCIGDIETERFSWHIALQQGWDAEPPSDSPTDYELHFGKTDILTNGTFGSTEVEVRHPTRADHGVGRLLGRHLFERPGRGRQPEAGVRADRRRVRRVGRKPGRVRRGVLGARTFPASASREPGSLTARRNGHRPARASSKFVDARAGRLVFWGPTDGRRMRFEGAGPAPTSVSSLESK